MKQMLSRRLIGAFLAAVSVLPAVAAGVREDTAQSMDARWRVAVQGVGGIYSGKVDRNGDWFAAASIEREWAMGDRYSVSVRFYPLFLYEGPETVCGAALGAALRAYQNGEECNGWFGEIGFAPMWHWPRFEGNSSDINFLTETGVGYQFPGNDWHISLCYHHISNGGMGSHNAGANGVGLSIGRTF